MKHVGAWLGLVLLLAACGKEDDAVPPGCPDTEPVVICWLKADGSVTLGRARASPDQMLRVHLGAEDPGDQDDALQAVAYSLRVILRDPMLRDEHGDSRARFVLEASPRAQWKYVQWLLQCASHPTVRMHAIELRLMGEARGTRVHFPRDAAFVATDVEDEMHVVAEVPVVPDPSADVPEAGAPARDDPQSRETEDPSRLHIEFFRRDRHMHRGAHTMLRIRGERYDLPKGTLPGDPAHEAAMQRPERVLDALLSSLPEDANVVIVAPPPLGGSVPFADILHVLRHVRAKKRFRILFEGASMPIWTDR